jgi:hypothetical protein
MSEKYQGALEKLRAGYSPYPQLCMDFLEGLGYSVEALGNEEILQLTEEILNEMDLEEL